MKKGLLYMLLIFMIPAIKAQDTTMTMEGTVTFVTQQNVYVKFSSTAGIKQGDTLYGLSNGTKTPLLRVTNLSSISCVCSPLTGIQMKPGDKLFSGVKLSPDKMVRSQEPSAVSRVADSTPAVTRDSAVSTGSSRKQLIRGFATAASYSTWSDEPGSNSQREKITFSFCGKNLHDSPFSAEIYFSYLLNDKLNTENKNLPAYLKIYNFNVSADFRSSSFLMGRKINPHLSSMGASDGIQYELRLKPLSIGIIAGFRPDYRDYGFNADLFQAGIYLYNEKSFKKGMMQNTFAFINQTNSGKTDRRYFYLQHMNSILKNLVFFGTAEMDMYSMKFNSIDSTYSSYTTLKLSNLFLSLSYRLNTKLSLSVSYNNRENTVYYETYKNYLDRLLDFETYQGFLGSATYSPVNRLSIGINSSYRYRQKDPRPGKNLYGFVTYRIPGVETSATASLAKLSTGYLNGNIYSFGISKDLARGKIYTGLNYRYVDYQYTNKEMDPLVQHIGEVNFTWRIISKLALSIYYEGTFESHTSYNRIFAQATLGF